MLHAALQAIVEQLFDKHKVEPDAVQGDIDRLFACPVVAEMLSTLAEIKALCGHDTARTVDRHLNTVRLVGLTGALDAKQKALLMAVIAIFDHVVTECEAVAIRDPMAVEALATLNRLIEAYV